MTAPAEYPQAQGADRPDHRTGYDGYLPYRNRMGMQGEDAVRPGILEGAFLDHAQGPAREEFLGRLKHKDGRSLEVVTQGGQDRSRAHEHGGVEVMAAGVHDPFYL